MVSLRRLVENVLNIVEIPFESGSVKFRSACYMAEDNKRWIRHGLFQQYYENGTLATEGTYAHGKEDGHWRDFHENGALAAEGDYLDGEKTGKWRYYDDDGELGEEETF